MASNMDREKPEKSKISNHVKHIPKDAQVIMSILKELGILDYEPRVINQLLEFTYRYVTCILDDAKVYANHGKKKTIDLEDVKLASQLLVDKSFTAPPTRDVLCDLSKSKNNTPLPLIKPHCGLRLPPDRYCLSACNYKLRAATQLKKLKKPAGESLINRPFKSTTPNLLTPKTEKIIKRPMSSTSIIPSITQKSIAIPKPFIKFSTTPKMSSGKSKSDDEIKMEMDDDDDDGITGQKRKREEEDDFEVV